MSDVPALRDHMARIEQYARAAHAPATLRSYRHHLRWFAEWCRREGLSGVFPVPPEVVAAFLVGHARSHAVGTLRQTLAVLRQAHHALELPFDARHPTITLTMRGIAKTHGVPVRQSAALGLREVKKLIACCGADLRGVRDKAIILIGFAGALRRSEIVGIDREHLHFDRELLRLFLPRSKTDQDGAGATVVIPRGNNRLTCPVVALERWIEMSACAFGPVFRGVDRWGGLYDGRMHAEGVRRLIRAHCAEAGIEAPPGETISPHGLRAGFVTEADKRKARLEDIMAHGRFKSQRVRRYIRRSRDIEDNPVRLMDL